MYPIYPNAAIVAAEHATGEELTSGRLMQKAASAVTTVALRMLRGGQRAPWRSRRVLLAVGSGNNGGDALWAGVRLRRYGIQVAAWRCASSVHAEGWAAFLAAGGRELNDGGVYDYLAEADLVIDGVLGLGGRGGLREPAASFATACADVNVPVLSVDLPSGLEADSNQVFPCFKATRTVTFAARKACHALQPAASYCGDLDVIDIGLDLSEPDLIGWEPADVAACWPLPDATSDKYSRGVVGIDTGSVTYPGAAVLSVGGAIYAGAGMVRYLGTAAGTVVAAFPNVVTASGRVQAHLLGSGWGDHPDGVAVLAQRFAESVPVIVDADAIGLVPDALAEYEGEHPELLLTPHAGELARLLRVERHQVENDPIAAVRRAARSFYATVLLKGATQYVATPRGPVSIAVPGPAWTAQAGSGDTLAGMCATAAASGLGLREAALAAASLQALTARAHPGPLPPQELVRHLPQTIIELTALRS